MSTYEALNAEITLLKDAIADVMTCWGPDSQDQTTGGGCDRQVAAVERVNASQGWEPRCVLHVTTNFRDTHPVGDQIFVGRAEVPL